MKNLFAVITVFGILSASSASAAIVGRFDFNGLNAVPAVVGDTYIDFGDPFSYLTSGCDTFATPCVFLPGTGRIDVSIPPPQPGGGGTNWFAGADTGVVRDLSLAAQPPGGTFAYDNFIRLNELPQFNFRLTTITAPGFVLSEVGGSTGVVFAGRGTVFGGPTPATFRVVFTTQFNESAQSLLARVDDETPAMSTYSATVTVEDVATVPEPASMALMGLVLSGMGVAIRRRPRA